MAAGLLTEERLVLTRVPRLADIDDHGELLAAARHRGGAGGQ